MAKHNGYKLTSAMASESFRVKARIAEERMYSLFECLPGVKCTLIEWLQQKQVHYLYPRAMTYLQRTENLDMELEITSMDMYTQHIAALNQVRCLCAQLQHDVLRLHNNKYIAHQVALLYTSVKVLCSEYCHPELDAIRENISKNFEDLNKSLIVENGQNSQLSERHKQWLTEITNKLSAIMTSFPPELSEDIEDAMNIIANIT